jgi:hypothetical protein
MLCYGVNVRTFCAVFVHCIRIRACEFISSDSQKGQTASLCDYNNKSKFVGKCKFDPLSNYQLLKLDSALWSFVFLCTVLTAPHVGKHENNVNKLF